MNRVAAIVCVSLLLAVAFLSVQLVNARHQLRFLTEPELAMESGKWYVTKRNGRLQFVEGKTGKAYDPYQMNHKDFDSPKFTEIKESHVRRTESE